VTVAEGCNKIDLSRMIRSNGLIDICREYNLKKYTSTSSVVDGVNPAILIMITVSYVLIDLG